MKKVIILVMTMVMILTTKYEVKANWTEESKKQIETNYAFYMALIANHDDDIVADCDYRIQFLDNDTYIFNYTLLTHDGDYDYGMMIVNKDGRVIKEKEIYKGQVYENRCDKIDGYCK